MHPMKGVCEETEVAEQLCPGTLGRSKPLHNEPESYICLHKAEMHDIRVPGYPI